MSDNRALSYSRARDIADDLRSEDGENPEYDRALHEFLDRAFPYEQHEGRTSDNVQHTSGPWAVDPSVALAKGEV